MPQLQDGKRIYRLPAEMVGELVRSSAKPSLLFVTQLCGLLHRAMHARYYHYVCQTQEHDDHTRVPTSAMNPDLSVMVVE